MKGKIKYIQFSSREDKNQLQGQNESVIRKQNRAITVAVPAHARRYKATKISF